MPLDRVDQLPLPSLHWYAAFSGLALSYATVYALTAQDGLFGTLFSDVWCTAVSDDFSSGVQAFYINFNRSMLYHTKGVSSHTYLCVY